MIQDIHHIFLPFQTTFVLVFAMISAGYVIRIYKWYKVNYPIIFELDTKQDKHKDSEMIESGFSYLFIWVLLFLG